MRSLLVAVKVVRGAKQLLKAELGIRENRKNTGNNI